MTDTEEIFNDEVKAQQKIFSDLLKETMDKNNNMGTAYCPSILYHSILENNNSVGSTGINMNNQEITNVSTITATNVKPTTILDINTSPGNTGQILSSTGSGIDWITLSGGGGVSSWIDTATSDLNMAGYNITSTGNISINPNVGANTLNLAGTVDVNSTLQINNGANVIRVSGGLANIGVTVTTNMNNVVGITERNQFFSVLITGTTGSQTLTLPSVKHGYYMVLLNYSTQSWTIAKQAGESFALGKGGTVAQGSATTMVLGAGASFYLFSANTGTPTYYIVSETFPRKSITNDTIVSSNSGGSSYLKTSSSANYTTFNSTTITGSSGTINYTYSFTLTPIVTATLLSTIADISNPLLLTSVTTTGFSWATSVAVQAGAKLNYFVVGTSININQ
jgi:hypothetical protein